MDSIIEALAEYFNPKFRQKLKRCENLTILIEKLEKKQLNISKKLMTEESQSVRDNLQTKLAVLNVQKEKAKMLLQHSKHD